MQDLFQYEKFFEFRNIIFFLSLFSALGVPLYTYRAEEKSFCILLRQPLLLYNFLFKGFKIIGVEKLGNGYFESVAKLFNGCDSGIFALSI